MRKVSRPKMRSEAHRITAPSASAMNAPLKATLAKKRRRSRFRFTPQKVKKLPGFDAFKVISLS
jgi:hypothetical protein